MNVRRALGWIVTLPATLFAAACSSDSTGPPDAGLSIPPDATDASDGYVPTDDPDAACGCRVEGAMGKTSSVRCFCEGSTCKTYEDALDDCPPVGDALFNQVKEYAACNLVEITYGGGYYASAYVFTATTHELVGARASNDTPTYDCGASKVFGIVAGTLPPSTCAVSSSRPRCPADLDASKLDAVMDARGDVPPNVALPAK